MIINFNETKEITIPGMNQGTGTMSAKMYMDSERKIIEYRIHPNSSIGLHKHDTSDDINYVISGSGYALCDSIKEELKPGRCHVCPKGSSHSIVNTGDEDLVILTVVIEK